MSEFSPLTSCRSVFSESGHCQVVTEKEGGYCVSACREGQLADSILETGVDLKEFIHFTEQELSEFVVEVITRTDIKQRNKGIS